ncbi:hypothetical protein [Paracoccus sp. SM22M-07]|uniref:hypothetical protein n=1 Tax=Paracoccus sp. SM22M-07 TaxID=1520813 RepID=UPI0009308E5F|nr:hypothetical protein [Paracoccus sp. SM22M-07]
MLVKPALSQVQCPLPSMAECAIAFGTFSSQMSIDYCVSYLDHEYRNSIIEYVQCVDVDPSLSNAQKDRDTQYAISVYNQSIELFACRLRGDPIC